MKTNFPNVIDHLRGAAWGDNPALQSEREMAIQILSGRTGPGELIDDFVLRLDRQLSRYEDDSAALEQRICLAEFPVNKHNLIGRRKMLNKIISDLRWFRARADFIKRFQDKISK